MAVKLKDIFNNEWEDFRASSKCYDLTRKAVHDNVWKLLHCKTLWMGLQIHQCKKHPKETKLIACTCKSRFCPSCGYKANLIWINKLLSKALHCDHQHLVFSLPSELREVVRYNRRLLLPILSRTVTKTIKQFIHRHKKLDYTPGIVSMLHTFGKGLKWHIHFHLLITAGGISNQNHDRWTNNSYLNADYLKKAWKAKLLATLRRLYRKGQLRLPYPQELFPKILSTIYEKKWHIWIQTGNGDSSFSFVYISRYAKRAPIAQKGIISYLPGKSIAWKEKTRHYTPDVCAYRTTPKDFIGLLIQHIPERYEHQVFYYGLYSSYHKNGLYQKARRLLGQSPQEESLLNKVKLTFSKLMQWLHNSDPLRCSICGEPLHLTGIIFLSPCYSNDKTLLENYEIKNYALAKKGDSS